MRTGLCIICCLMGCIAVAQERITNFEGRSYETPNGVQKLDTLNGKLIFSIRRPESDWYKLWVTDGKPENTHLLQDEAGKTIEGSPWRAKAYGYLYLDFPYTGLYRTRGDFLEMVRPKPDSLLSVHSFNGKLLLYFGHIEQNPNTETRNFSHLDWLNTDNSIVRLADNVLHMQIIDSTLTYISADYSTGNLWFCKVDKKGQLSQFSVLMQGSQFNISSFLYFSDNDHDFCFLYTDKGTKLVMKPAYSEQRGSVLDWGEQPVFPNIVYDTAGETYFLKQSKPLKLFVLNDDGTLHEKWSVSTENIRDVQPFMNGGVVGYQNFKVRGNKLVFSSYTASIGSYGFYLHIFDLRSGENRLSRNLFQYFNNSSVSVTMSKADTSIFFIDNNTGKKLTYNFSTDSVSNIVNYPFEFPYERDTLLTINQETLLLKNNIYNITKGTKTPLIPTRQIFEQYDSRYFIYKVLIDRIIFINYNSSEKLNEVWASKGEKNDAQLIAGIPGDFSYTDNAMQERNGRLYFYIRKPERGMVFYETDGTREGTLKIDEIVDPMGLDSYQTVRNDKFIVFGLRNNNAKGALLIIENDNKRLVEFEVKGHYDIYLTNTDIYLMVRQDMYRDLYKVVGNEVMLIESDIQEVVTYLDYVLYTKIVDSQGDRYALMTVDKANMPVRFIPHNISIYNIVGSRLVYSYRVNQGLVSSVFDLASATLEIDKMLGTFDNGKVYLNDVLIMVRDAQAVFIRGSHVQVFDLGFPARYGLIPFAGGVLFMGETDLLYYDIDKGKADRILRNKAYNTQALRQASLQGSEYFLVQVDTGNYKYIWAYWAISEKQLNYLDETVSWLSDVNPAWVLSGTNDNNRTYWYYNGWRLLKKYILPPFASTTNIFQVNGSAFAFFKTPTTGNELYQLGPDSLVAYPEIVPGPEGMEGKHLFEFNKKIYVYGFTYAHGWQVWKMGEARTFITNTEPVEEVSANHLLVFPNPTQDWLHIKSEKTLPYRLINTRGQVLIQGNITASRGINLQQVPQGIYLLQLIDDGRVYVQKIVKE